MWKRFQEVLLPGVSTEFRETTYAATKRKVEGACKVTILLWIVTLPLELVLVPDKIPHFFAIRAAVISAALLLILFGRRSDPRASYAMVIALFSVVTAGFIGFSYLYQAGLQVINQALLSFVFLLGLSVVWPPLYTLIAGFAIVTAALGFQFLTAGPSEKMFVDTIYLYSAMVVATILTRLNYSVAESAFKTEDQLAQIQAMHFKLEDDLKMARQTQMSMIPTQMPEVSGLKVRARYRAMEELGGDFYGFQTGQGRLGILLADVSGHGVPAALIVSTLNLAFNYYHDEPLDPPELLTRMNGALWDNIGGEFVTGSYASYDQSTGLLKVGSAGHPPVLVWKAGQRELRRLKPDGRILGLLPETEYSCDEVRLEPGDRVLLYTDGAYDASNLRNELFGQDRLERFVVDNNAIDADVFLDRLIERIVAWCDRPEGIGDDVALVMLQKT